MNTERILASAAASPSLLVGTDFDGTLSEIVPVPDDALPAPGAMDVLDALARNMGVTVSIVSGRSLADLNLRTAAARGVWRVGEHGSQIADPGGALLRDAGESKVALDTLEQLASTAVAHVPGIRLERKTSALAVHWRQVGTADRRRALVAIEEWAEGARRFGFMLIEGRQVHEARRPGCDKAGSLAFIAEQGPKGTLILYAGDDVTDEPAIAYARSRGGVGIYIASTERPRPGVEVDLCLGSPQEWISFLGELTARRARDRAW